MNYRRVDPSDDEHENNESPKSSFHTPSPRSSSEESHHGTNEKPNCSSTLTPAIISSSTGVPKKASRIFIDEFTRSRLCALESRRKKWRFLSLVWTVLILLATIWMAIEDAVSSVHIRKAVFYDYDRASLALAYLVLRVVCILIACSVLLWVSFFQRLSRFYTLLLLACTFTSFIQVALSVINVVLAYCWQTDSFPSRSILNRCDWTIDVVWRWGPAGKTCDEIDSFSAWQIAAWLRLLFTIIVLTIWILCLCLHARSLIALNILRGSYEYNSDEVKSLIGSRTRVNVHLPAHTQASSPVTPYTGQTSSISSKVDKGHSQALLAVTGGHVNSEESKSPTTSLWDPIDWVFGLDETDVAQGVAETRHLWRNSSHNKQHNHPAQYQLNSESESPFSRDKSLESQEQDDPLWSIVTPAAVMQQHNSSSGPSFSPLALDDPFLAIHNSGKQPETSNSAKDPALHNALVIPLSKPRKPLPIPPIQQNSNKNSTDNSVSGDVAKSVNSLALSLSSSSTPTIKGDRVAEWAASQSPVKNMASNRESSDSSQTVKLPEIIRTDMDSLKEFYEDGKLHSNKGQSGGNGEEEETDVYESAAEFGLSSATGQSSTTSTNSSKNAATTNSSSNDPDRLSPYKISKATSSTSEDLPLSTSVRSVRTNGTDSPTLGRELKVDEIGQLHHQLRLLERDQERWTHDKQDSPELSEKVELGKASLVQLSYPTSMVQTLYPDSSSSVAQLVAQLNENSKKGYIASQPKMGDRYTHQPGMCHRSDSQHSGRVVYVRMSDGKLVRKLSTIRSEGSDRRSSLSNLSARSFGVI